MSAVGSESRLITSHCPPCQPATGTTRAADVTRRCAVWCERVGVGREAQGLSVRCCTLWWSPSSRVCTSAVCKRRRRRAVASHRLASQLYFVLRLMAAHTKPSDSRSGKVTAPLLGSCTVQSTLVSACHSKRCRHKHIQSSQACSECRLRSAGARVAATHAHCGPRGCLESLA